MAPAHVEPVSNRWSRVAPARNPWNPATITILTLAAIFSTVGCETPPPDGAPRAGPRLSPVLQRMQQAYADLEGRRSFISLADFESPEHVRLFRTVGADGTETGQPQPELSILRSRNETGAGGLKARLEDAAARLRFDGQRSRELALIRDWRPYTLLLMSVYGPPDGATLEFSVISGEDTPLAWSRTLTITKGWGVYRFDLATLGESIDLGDVRALEWHAPSLAQPLEFYLDDLILVDNTTPRLNAERTPDTLYAFTRGRRVHVGTSDRFELAFMDGLITTWRGASGETLCDPGGLGPWPIPLPLDWTSRAHGAVAYDDPDLFAPWGPHARATQQIVELTPARAVIEGTWRFPAELAPNDDIANAPGHTWRYTLYPTGQLYVQVRSTAGPPGWNGPRVGYAIGLRGRVGFLEHAPPPADPAELPVPFVLLSRTGADRTDLLWTWSPADALTQQRVQISADQRRLAVLAGDVPAAEEVTTSHFLRLWPADLEALPEARALAVDYQIPATVHVVTGARVLDAPGDRDADGFNEAEGCYELALVGDVLRFDFVPGPYLRFDPLIRVHGTAERDGWVYVRGRRLEPAGRDAAGRLLVRLPRVVATRTLVEVVTTAPTVP